MLVELLRSLHDRLEPLRSQLYRPCVTLLDRAFWEGVDPQQRRYWTTRGERYLGFEWPALTDDMYSEYERTGDRTRFEAPYHRRRQVVSTLVLAEGFEARGRFLPALFEGLGQICAEPTWVLPAHRGQAIDIFSAETANLLAWILHVFPDAATGAAPGLRRRIEQLLRDRVIEPYLTRNDLWWLGNDGHDVGNWTTWCTSNCLGTILLVEPDDARRWQALEKACASLDRFLDVYGEDGGCDEGPTYWNFAAGCLFDSLELLYDASGGVFDCFAHPAVQKLGAYIYKMHVNDLHFVNFADSPPEVPVDAALMWRYGRRTGDAQLEALGAHLYGLLEQRDPEATIRLKLNRTLATLAEESALRASPAAMRPPRQAYLERLQVMVAREHERPGHGLLLAAKGGHNDEGHNHNDVGNVVVYLDGLPMLIDVGMKQYSKASFSDQRYQIWAVQSGYHNVPLVNGSMQAHGPRHAARSARFLADGAQTSFSMDIAAAYPKAARLLAWERRCELSRGSSEVWIDDCFEFERDGNRYELRYMTARLPVMDGRGAVLLEAAPGRRLSLRTSPRASRITRHAFPLRDRHLRHAWGDTLYQVRFCFEAVPRHGRSRTVVSLAPPVGDPTPEPAGELLVEELD